VSRDTQDLNNQKLEILEFARRHDIQIDEFIEIEISSRKTPKERRINELLEKVAPGFTIIVSELSRISRSISEAVGIIDELVKHQIRFIAIKQNLCIDGQHDMASKTMVTVFSLLGELERDLISSRTKQALINARLQNKQISRPKGSTSRSKLDGKQKDIIDLLKYGVAKAAIARMMNCSRTALVQYIKSRGLQ